MRTRKLAISLPEDLYQEIEHRRASGALTRSAAIQQMLRALLSEERKRHRVAEYVRAYTEHPETEGEVRQSETVVAATWAEPWDARRGRGRR